MKNLSSDSLSILLIEDNPGDYILFQRMVSKLNLSIHELKRAESISQAEDLATQFQPQLIFLDLTLPDSEGIESFNEVLTLYPGVPIIVLSGLSNMSIATETISLGAQDYLVKGEYDEKLLSKTILYSLERHKTLKNLQFLNERFQLVTKSAQDIIWEWDITRQEFILTHGNFLLHNQSSVQSHISTESFLSFIHPNDRSKVKETLEKVLHHSKHHIYGEFRVLNSQNKYRDFYARGYRMLNEFGKPYRYVGSLTDVTQQNRIRRELARQHLRQQKLITEATIQTQEQERNYLGKELHDNINQILATVKMYLEMCLRAEDKQQHLIEKSYKNLGVAINEIRSLSKNLVSPLLDDIGLEEAIVEMVNEMNFLQQLTLHFKIEIADEASLPNALKIMLFRIVQEQMNNIYKHANATAVTIALQIDGVIELSISDNGRGFDNKVRTKGLGFHNIKSRVEFYNGTLAVESTQGKGVSVIIKIPYEKSDNLTLTQ